MSTEAITQSIISESITTPSPQDDGVVGQSGEINTDPSPGQDDPQLSHKLSILSKRERAILAEQQKLNQKLKEIEERSLKLSKWEELDKLSSENPAEFFKQKGLSFEQIQQKMLESLNDEDLDPIQKQLKELQNKLASKDEEFQKLLDERFNKEETTKKEREIEEQSKIINQNLKQFLSEKADEYDLINTFEASDEVFNVIKTVYLKTAESGSPKLMTFEEASGMYEKKLEELVQGMKKSKKVSNIFGVSDSEDPFAQVLGQKTIDDSFSQSSSTRPDLKTEQERLRAAAQLFEQQIKQL